MENPNHKWSFIVRWENHLFLWAMVSMAMLNNQRVTILIPVTLVVMIIPVKEHPRKKHPSRKHMPHVYTI